jgi:hypothetical protein
MHVYEVRPRKDHRGVDLISDVRPRRDGTMIQDREFRRAALMNRTRAWIGSVSINR